MVLIYTLFIESPCLGLLSCLSSAWMLRQQARKKRKMPTATNTKRRISRIFAVDISIVCVMSISLMVLRRQRYGDYAESGISNCTNALQMECKFITSKCKTHYKLYKMCKKPCKNYCRCIIPDPKLYFLYHLGVLGLNPSFSSFCLAR